MDGLFAAVDGFSLPINGLTHVLRCKFGRLVRLPLTPPLPPFVWQIQRLIKNLSPPCATLFIVCHSHVNGIFTKGICFARTTLHQTSNARASPDLSGLLLRAHRARLSLLHLAPNRAATHKLEAFIDGDDARSGGFRRADVVDSDRCHARRRGAARRSLPVDLRPRLDWRNDADERGRELAICFHDWAMGAIFSAPQIRGRCRQCSKQVL